MEEKVGQAEVTNADLKAELKTQEGALNAESKVDGMSDAAVDDRLRSKSERDWDLLGGKAATIGGEAKELCGYFDMRLQFATAYEHKG